MAEHLYKGQGLPKTNEDFEKLRVEFKRDQSDLGCLIVLWACVLGVLITVLPWEVSGTKLPAILRPLWNPYGLVLPVGGALWLLLALTPVARRSKRYKRVGQGINAYDLSVRHFNEWKRTHKRKSLTQCHSFLKLAQPYMQDVPMFIQFSEEVEAVWRESK